VGASWENHWKPESVKGVGEKSRGKTAGNGLVTAVLYDGCFKLIHVQYTVEEPNR
jgi:hypothetical protein